MNFQAQPGILRLKENDIGSSRKCAINACSCIIISCAPWSWLRLRPLRSSRPAPLGAMIARLTLRRRLCGVLLLLAAGLLGLLLGGGGGSVAEMEQVIVATEHSLLTAERQVQARISHALIAPAPAPAPTSTVRGQGEVTLRTKGERASSVAPPPTVAGMPAVRQCAVRRDQDCDGRTAKCKAIDLKAVHRVRSVEECCKLCSGEQACLIASWCVHTYPSGRVQNSCFLKGLPSNVDWQPPNSGDGVWSHPMLQLSANPE